MRPLFNVGAHGGCRDNAGGHDLSDRGHADVYDGFPLAQDCHVRVGDVRHVRVHECAPMHHGRARDRDARLSVTTPPHPSKHRQARALS